MKRTFFLCILTIMLTIAFVPTQAFGVETIADERSFDGVVCEADVNPEVRMTDSRSDLVEERRAAHIKLRDLMTGYADRQYYLETPENYYNLSEEQIGNLTNVARKATNNCNTDYKKIKTIYEFVAENIYFDYDYYSGASTTTNYGYDAWIKRVTVCSGYTDLCCMFLNLIDIPCMYVRGYNHAYNAAYDGDNGQWVFFDSTWGSGNKYIKGKKISGDYNLDYFDMSTSFISRLENHECLFTSLYMVDEKKGDVRYSLSTPNNANGWPKISNWHITIDSALSKDVEYAVVPCSSMCKIPVTTVGSGAFCGCKKLKTVELPNSITIIEDSAFYGCNFLEENPITPNVAFIGHYAFRKCFSLREVTFPEVNLAMGDYVFCDCKSLEKVVFQRPVKSIGKYTFSNCSSLETLHIPEGTVAIESKAFSGCNNLKMLSIPDSVNYIDDGAFDHCSKLTIYCNHGSFAHSFAEEYDYDYKIWTQIEDCDISISEDVFEVSRVPSKVVITVRDGDRILTEGVDYEITSTDVEIGTVYITISGLDNYIGSATVTYEIIDHQWCDFYTVDREPTCTSDGMQAIRCMTCGATKGTEILDKTGHAFGEWEDITGYPCLNPPGLRQRSCNTCGYTEIEGLLPDGHNWEESYTLDVEPKCATDGSMSIHCKDCGARKDSEVIPAKGHYLFYYDGKPATCMEEGHAPYEVCKNCDYNTYIAIPKVDHKWNHIIEPAGLLKNGSEYDKCKVCGVETLSETLPGYAHYYVKSFKLKSGKKAVTAKWDKRSAKTQKKFNGYQVKYSERPDMSNAKKKNAKKNSTGKTIKNLKKNKRYYVQVRTYTMVNGKYFFSKWSEIKTVKTK